MRHNYELERRLAAELRSASASERRSRYAAVYDEFVAQSLNVASTKMDPREIARQVRIVTHFLPVGGRYLEVGAGTCGVAAQMALSASTVQVAEVSEAMVIETAGVERIPTDGVGLPVAAGSIDLAFSNQVLEHLHPDDAFEHAQSVQRALAPGGMYVCITPNRLTGPHDISRYFGNVHDGFHLKEYSVRDQYDLFRSAGFREVRVAVALGGEIIAVVPAPQYCRLEAVCGRLAVSLRRRRVLAKVLNPGAVVAYA